LQDHAKKLLKEDNSAFNAVLGSRGDLSGGLPVTLMGFSVE